MVDKRESESEDAELRQTRLQRFGVPSVSYQTKNCVSDREEQGHVHVSTDLRKLESYWHTGFILQLP